MGIEWNMVFHHVCVRHDNYHLRDVGQYLCGGDREQTAVVLRELLSQSQSIWYVRTQLLNGLFAS